MKNSVYFIGALFILLCCHQPKETSVWVIDLEKSNVSNLNEVFTDYELIPFEVNSDAQIVEFSKLVALDNYLYILDRPSAAIVLFNAAGSYIDKLDAFGEGPGEYLEISDFNINPFNGNVEIISPDGELLIYSKEFSFLDRIPLEGLSSFQYFDYLNDDVIALNSIDFRNTSPVVLFSRSQAKIVGHIDFPFTEFEKNFIFLLENIFFRNEEGLFICTRFSNDVYQIELNQLSFRNKFDFKDYAFYDNSLASGMTAKYYSDYLKEKISNSFASFKKYAESSDQIVFQFPFKNRTGLAVLDKKSGEYKILYRYFSFDYFSYETREIFSIIAPDNISNYLFWEEWSSQDRQILQNAQQEEIPLILKFKTK